MTDASGGPGPGVATDELDVLATRPLVAETRLDQQRGQHTPNREFFIRNHFGIPDLDAASWSITLGGHVERPRQFTVADLRSLPARRLAAVVECAGNGRSFLPLPWEGNPFSYGAVSNASWTGVSLAEVLGPSGLKAGTREVRFAGADRGFEKNVGQEIAFERSLPLDVAMHPDTLLVYEMNGEPLPREHGFPVRLLVPGWYGVASVKWLAEIRALDQPFDGYFQVQRYILPNEDGPPTPLTERGVRAVITEPIDGAALRAGPIEVRGLAWSGNQPVQRVELSLDGGATWQPTELDAPESPYAWQRWHTIWHAGPGPHTLKARAADAAGRGQPDAGAWNYLGYANNGVQALQFTVNE